jgi:arylsulfatase A-like enzyme
VKCNLTGSKGPFLGTWQAMNGGGSSAKTTLWEAGHRTIGLASWPGMIDAGRVSAATTSTLDYFATLASLAEAPLPTDRVYDGIDLSPVLFNKAESARTTLFHPNSGASGVNGALDAVRYYDLKAVYQTGGAPGCGGGKGPSIHRVTPLLFNLTADPAEEHPLDPKVYAAHISTIDQIREDIGNNINNTFKSFTDYTTNDASEPCCNTANRGKGCRCTE